jgi:hypothetical protein
MNTRFATLEKEVADALWTLGREVELSSKGGWRWHVDDRGGAPVDVRLEDEWFTCQLPVPSPSSEAELWRTVERSSFLDGACKVMVEPRDNTFHIRQDVPVTEDGDFPSFCRHALEDVVSARRKHLNSNGGDATSAREEHAKSNDTKTNELPAPLVVSTTAAGALKDACIEAGWCWSERVGGEPSVDLDVPHGSRKVVVEAFPGEGCRLSVSLARHKSLSGTSRAAAAVFLLTANAFVRFARAGLEESESGVEMFYEVWIDERPTPAVVGHALSSLSIGCRFCEEELQVLGDENVARTYLETRGTLLEAGTRSPRKRVPARQG